MFDARQRRWGLVAVLIAAFALLVFAGVGPSGGVDSRDDEEGPAVRDRAVWSIVSRRDGSVAASRVDVDSYALVGEVVGAPAARSAVLSTVFNGEGVAQLLENGEVRWLGLTIDPDGEGAPMFVERVLWRGAPVDEPDAIRLTAAGRTVFMAIENGLGVYYRDLAGPALRLRLWTGGRDMAVEIGGAGETLATGRGSGRLVLVGEEQPRYEEFVKEPRAEFVGLEDAGTSILMLFDDGAIVGRDLDSGVSYEVWPQGAERQAVAVDGTPTVAYVVVADGDLVVVTADDQQEVVVPGDGQIADVDVAGRGGSAVATDGTVMHFDVSDQPELLVSWPTDVDVVAASLIQPVEADR